MLTCIDCIPKQLKSRLVPTQNPRSDGTRMQPNLSRFSRFREDNVRNYYPPFCTKCPSLLPSFLGRLYLAQEILLASWWDLKPPSSGETGAIKQATKLIASNVPFMATMQSRANLAITLAWSFWLKKHSLVSSTSVFRTRIAVAYLSWFWESTHGNVLYVRNVLEKM